jgi:hypothetical protein
MRTCRALDWRSLAPLCARRIALLVPVMVWMWWPASCAMT